MGELKTKKTTANPKAFIKTIRDKEKQRDSLELLKIFTDITGQKATMWGTSIIGFGQYHYESERSAQKGDWFLTGFSPRVQNLTLYVMPGMIKESVLFKKLGPHTKTGGCLYIKHLSDVDVDVLKKLIKAGYQTMSQRYPR